MIGSPASHFTAASVFLPLGFSLACMDAGFLYTGVPSSKESGAHYARWHKAVLAMPLRQPGDMTRKCMSPLHEGNPLKSGHVPRLGRLHHHHIPIFTALTPKK